jgi:hypothetical protein
VRVLDPLSRAVLAEFRVFGQTTGGARVAVGDVNADGFSDVIIAGGTGSRVQVIDGSKFGEIPPGAPVPASAILANLKAYGAGFGGGVFVAAGDVNGDGRADVITGPGAGKGTVQVIDGGKLTQVNGVGLIAPSALLGSLFAFAPGFTGGVTVAAADVNGDGREDVIAGMAKKGSVVKVFDGAALPSARLLSAFRAFAPSYKRGVFVAGADVTGDGRAEIVVGAGVGGPPVAKVFGADGSLRNTFLAFAPKFKGGVRVAAADIADAGTVGGPERDGVADLVFGQGPSSSQAVIHDGETFSVFASFFPIPGARGIFVAS